MQDNEIDELVKAVRAGARYRSIGEEVVRHVASQELLKRRSLKEAVKTTRNKLHQVGGAYQETQINYQTYNAELEKYNGSPRDSDFKAFCIKVMEQHASTRERIPVLEEFYEQTLAPLAPIHSILDLACGLNPLALPWMPLAEQVEYYACDIYEDMINFIQHYFDRCGVKGQGEICDLTTECPARPVQVAFLLKTIPCLEQLEKGAGLRLMKSIQAEHILVSYPALSLGGRSKGMTQFYEKQFLKLVEEEKWHIQRFDFPNEFVYRLDRKKG